MNPTGLQQSIEKSATLAEFLCSLNSIRFYCSRKNNEAAIAFSVMDKQGKRGKPFMLLIRELPDKPTHSAPFSNNQTLSDFLTSFFSALSDAEKTVLDEYSKTKTADFHYNLLRGIANAALQTTVEITQKQLHLKNVQLSRQTKDFSTLSCEYSVNNQTSHFTFYLFGSDYFRIEANNGRKVDPYDTFIKPLESLLKEEYPGIFLRNCFGEPFNYTEKALRKLVVQELLVSKTYQLKSKFNHSNKLSDSIFRAALQE